MAPAKSSKKPRYRSNFERKFHQRHPTAKFEPIKVPYTTHHTYTPDFVLEDGTVVECKGLFTGADRQKHLTIRKQHPDFKVRFCFQDASRRLTKASSTTYAQWCDKHGFDWEQG